MRGKISGALRLSLREGEKGTLKAEYLHAMVWIWDGAEKQAHRRHLLVRREVGANEVSHYCLSNAPLETPLQKLAQVQAQRFFIEHSFHEANAAWPIIKYAGGMHSIITWRWSCWQRYSWSSKRCLGASNGRCYPSNDLVTALAHMLPQRQLTTEDLADIIHKQHRRRLSAKKSSARRKVAFE